MDMGVNAFIQKPFELTALADIVADFADRICDHRLPSIKTGIG
jgi:hypothetical protein